MDHRNAILSPRLQAMAPRNQNADAIHLDAPPARLPGGFWRRTGAAIMDSIICSLLQMPVSLAVGFAIGVTGALHEDGLETTTPLIVLLNVASYLLSLAVAFTYYGWFYKHKGATPGKMLLRLRVARADTGTNISYWRAFGREILGKGLGALLLGIGLLMVAFRRDKRGLHDLLFNTQVTYEPR